MENPPENSKSLVLITRVGSTPTTGIKKRTSPACLGEFSFLSAACERVEQHGPALQGERSALRAVAQCAGDPHHRHKKELPQLVWGSFLFYLRRVSGSNSTALLCRASDQPCGLSLSARETPTTGIKKKLPQLVWGSFAFLSAACEHDLVVCIGRDRHTGLHHFQPVHEKIVEKYGMMTLPIS